MYVYYPYMRQQANQQWLMVLTGTGQVSVTPNVVNIELGIVTEDEQLQRAQLENNQVFRQVIAALRQLGILEEQIQTSQYQVHPVYDFVDGEQRLRGYQVNHMLTVTIEDVEQAGLIIDTAVKQGANQVLNVQFLVNNESEYYHQALRLALNDVTHKAKSIAEELHVRLNTTPIKIEELRQEGAVPLQTLVYKQQVAETPIQPGQISIEAEVIAYFQYTS